MFIISPENVSFGGVQDSFPDMEVILTFHYLMFQNNTGILTLNTIYNSIPNYFWNQYYLVEELFLVPLIFLAIRSRSSLGLTIHFQRLHPVFSSQIKKKDKILKSTLDTKK